MKLPEPPEPHFFIGNVLMLPRWDLESYGRECANAALEAAAQVCDEMQATNPSSLATLYITAHSIRALKEHP